MLELSVFFVDLLRVDIGYIELFFESFNLGFEFVDLIISLVVNIFIFLSGFSKLLSGLLQLLLEKLFFPDCVRESLYFIVFGHIDYFQLINLIGEFINFLLTVLDNRFVCINELVFLFQL